MPATRKLLSIGLGKLGEGIHAFNLPPVTTCPGRTPSCVSACYARKYRFTCPATIKRLKANLIRAKQDTFVEDMTKEITRRGVIICRIHSSGDFALKGYAEKWLSIIRACPRVTFYAYSRSHVIPEIREVLALMALESNCKIWFSLDADMECRRGTRPSWPTPLPVRS